MSWSKIEDKSKKPIGWWYHKLLCEFGWWVRNNVSYSIGDGWFRHHLYAMWVKYRRTIYGNKL